MRLAVTASLASFAGLVVAVPLEPRDGPYDPFPLADGFPNPNPAQLLAIQALAGGSLPNGPLPTALTASATTTIQLIALNEIFEVAFFTSLLTNITNYVPGYELAAPAYDRDFIIKSLTAIVNQEKLHYLGANAALTSANQIPILPCKYNFPVSNYLDAITLANTFTDVVLGVLPMAQTVFGSDGGQETPLVGLFGSVLAQEGEQNGWYRTIQRKVASAAPFLTTEGPSFAFTFLQGVLAPGSCPNIGLISAAVPTFGPLTVTSNPTETDATVTFGVPATVDASTNSIVYLSGQNLPVTVPIGEVTSIGGISYFNASFPFMSSSQFARGLTIAALVQGCGVTFASAAEVATATLFGPGIIEVN